VSTGVSTEISDEMKRPQWNTKSKQPSPPADTEDDTDERLWAGASAAGWSVKPRTNNGHYTYTAPDGRRFPNKREALEAAAETAPSSGAGAGTEVGGPSGGSGARAVDGAEATAPGRAGTGAGIGVGSRVVNKAGTRGEIVARSGAWLTMRTEAGEERSVLNRAELTLLSAGVAGEAGEAGSGAVRAAPATAEEPESLTGHLAKKRLVGAEARQPARQRQEEEHEERKRRA